MSSKFPIVMTDVIHHKYLIETKDVVYIVSYILKNLRIASHLGHTKIILALNADVNHADLVETLEFVCSQYKILDIYPRRKSPWPTVRNDIVEYVIG